MGEFLPFLREMTPGGWGIWTGVLMFAGWLLREWRETRKLSLDDRLARRDGYAKQVESLQQENRDLRSEINKNRTEHEEYRHLCHAENDQLRRDLRDALNEIAGLKRDISAQGIELGKMKGALGMGNSPLAEASIQRVIELRGSAK